MKTALVVTVCAATLLSGCATAKHSVRQKNRAPARHDTYPGEVMIAAPSAAVHSTASGIVHTVKPRETLWSIAQEYNVDLGALAQANSITDYSSIVKGQVLTIPAKQKSRTNSYSSYIPRHSNKKIAFVWPVKGRIISQFGDKIDKGVNKGVDIRAAEGMDVAAARDGRVVYCDSFLKGFGKTVIIDHMDNYQTVYSYNSDILVKVGDTVQQNQTIARVGQSGRAKEPMLHFEIRKNGEPENPVRYLP